MSFATFREGLRANAAAIFFFPAGAVAPGSAGAAFPAAGFPLAVAMRCPPYPFGEMTASIRACRSRVTARGTLMPLMVANP